MGKRTKRNYHTGKVERIPDNSITFDSNMVGYLYVLSKGNVTIQEHARIKRALSPHQYDVAMKIVKNNFEGFTFHTTPQIIAEIIAYAKFKNDYNVIDFLAKLCKIHIPKSREGKVQYAELIADLMQAYIEPTVVLSETGLKEPAIDGEMKNNEINYADAKIIAENAVLNGGPVATNNAKHLVEKNSIPVRNSIRREAIRIVNKGFVKNHKRVIKSARVRSYLHNPRTTTYRVSEIPDLLNGRDL